MAGAGGAWKVAYADFVTAMMAFFLVMWLVTQDKQVKESVARYFTDPSGFYQIGSNKRPSETGSLFETEHRGKVPGKTYQVSGRGRGAHIDRGQGEAETRIVSDWLLSSPDDLNYWQKQAERQREAAARSESVRDKTITVDQATRMQLAQQIQGELAERMPMDLDPMYRQLLDSALLYVDWTGVADEILAKSAGPM
jgi:flagellar motor protein MotB